MISQVKSVNDSTGYNVQIWIWSGLVEITYPKIHRERMGISKPRNPKNCKLTFVESTTQRCSMNRVSIICSGTARGLVAFPFRGIRGNPLLFGVLQIFSVFFYLFFIRAPRWLTVTYHPLRGFPITTHIYAGRINHTDKQSVVDGEQTNERTDWLIDRKKNRRVARCFCSSVLCGWLCTLIVSSFVILMELRRW